MLSYIVVPVVKIDITLNYSLHYSHLQRSRVQENGCKTIKRPFQVEPGWGGAFLSLFQKYIRLIGKV